MAAQTRSPATEHIGLGSRSNTITDDDLTVGGNEAPTPGDTLTDLTATNNKAGLTGEGLDLPAQSALGVTEKRLEAEGIAPNHVRDEALSSLPNGRKNLLLLCFCLSM